MGDINLIVQSVHDCPIIDKNSPYDKLLPRQPEKQARKSKKISYFTPSGNKRIITLNKTNKYYQAIFYACAFALKSEWFNGLNERSKPNYLEKIKSYFEWINESSNTTDKPPYDTLKLFEEHCLNDRKLKATPLTWINPVIREGMNCHKISDCGYHFLQTLTSLSKPSKPTEKNSVTLSGWFDMPWLRCIIGQEKYFTLESPKQLLLSFRVTIATTLLYLLKQRKSWDKFPSVEFNLSDKHWQYDWCRELLRRVARFNKTGEPEDDFTQLLLMDIVKPSGQEALRSKIVESESLDFPRNIYYKKSKIIPWQSPVLFHPEYQGQYSRTEELLCSWLIACEAIQPTDILKLKKKNYTREHNAAGRLIAMECNYYKGRSGTMKKPSILMGYAPWTRALDQYITGLSSDRLFRKIHARPTRFTSFKINNPINLLLKIWRLPSLQKILEAELKKAHSAPVFLDAMLALESGDESYTQFYGRTGNEIEKYRKLTLRPLPSFMFTLTHIKNTAVHSGSDSYRSGDLINHHSHTSLTEKTSYLTDKNKEWVNQAGRITRLILHDLQNVTYHPSITSISQSVHELELRTRIKKATNTNDIMVHSIQFNPSQNNNNIDFIVTDTSDTALYFIHYITQAEELFPKLLETRPDWVERTLLVQVEWMTRTLNRMQSASNAQKVYKSIEAHLPPLFDYLLETTE